MLAVVVAKTWASFPWMMVMLLAGLQTVPGDDQFVSQFTDKVTVDAGPNPFWNYREYAQMEQIVADQVQAVQVNDADPASEMQQAGQQIQKFVG